MATKERLTNSGKKEQRQYGQVLDKAVKEDRLDSRGQPREVESRTTPKQHASRRKSSK